MWIIHNQKLRVIALALGLLLILLISLYHANIRFINQDWLRNSFLILFFVEIGVIVLDFIVFLAKNISCLFLYIFRKMIGKKQSKATNQSGTTLSSEMMDRLLDELSQIVNDASLTNETKAKKQLEVFQKYGINPDSEEQKIDTIKHEITYENMPKRQLEIFQESKINRSVENKRKGVSKRGLIFAIALLLLSINAVYPLIVGDFSRNTDMSSYYLLISVVITLPISAFLLYVFKNNSRQEITKRNFWSKADISMSLLLSPLVILAFVWMNVAIAMPRFYTTYFGTDSIVDDFGVKKEYVSSRSSRCKYVIIAISLQDPFSWCLSKNEFYALPYAQFPVRIHQKSTPYGSLILNLTTHPKTDPESRKLYFDACVETETQKILRRFDIDPKGKFLVLIKKAIESREGISIENMAVEACSRFK